MTGSEYRGNGGLLRLQVSLLLWRGGAGTDIPFMAGFDFVGLIQHKQHLLLVRLHHTAPELLVHRQRPVIGLNDLQHQVQFRQHTPVQGTVFMVPLPVFSHTR